MLLSLRNYYLFFVEFGTGVHQLPGTGFPHCRGGPIHARRSVGSGGFVTNTWIGTFEHNLRHTPEARWGHYPTVNPTRHDKKEQLRAVFLARWIDEDNSTLWNIIELRQLHLYGLHLHNFISPCVFSKLPDARYSHILGCQARHHREIIWNLSPVIQTIITTQAKPGTMLRTRFDED